MQGVFHILIVSLFLVSLHLYKRFKHISLSIAILIVIELTVATRFNMNTTITDRKLSPVNMQRDLDLCPSGFPIPVNDKIKYNTSQHAFFKPFWRNTSIFTKQISFDAYSSFELNSYKKLDDEFPNLQKAVTNNHLFYYSDTIIPLSLFDDSKIEAEKSSDYLFLSDEDFNILSKKIVQTDSSDNIHINDFNPDKVIVTTNTKHNTFFTMLQTDFKGWSAFIDNKPVPVFKSNYNYRSIFLPAGNHVVKYEYRNRKILIYYIISNSLFILSILFLIGFALYYRNSKNRLYIIIPSILLTIVVFASVKIFKSENTKDTIFEQFEKNLKNKPVLLSIEQDFESEKTDFDTLKVSSGKKSYAMKPEKEFLSVLSFTQKDVTLKNASLYMTAYIYTDEYVTPLIVSEINKNWHGSKIETQTEKLHSLNRIHYFRNIPELKAGEELKVYFWNPGKSKFFIDQIRLYLYQN
jgi:hypothetical protein